MRCCFHWCKPERSPAIGIANLRGLGNSNKGVTGTYALCQYHYTEALNGNWHTVVLEGWEPLPVDGPQQPPQDAVPEGVTV